MSNNNISAADAMAAAIAASEEYNRSASTSHSPEGPNSADAARQPPPPPQPEQQHQHHHHHHEDQQPVLKTNSTNVFSSRPSSPPGGEINVASTSKNKVQMRDMAIGTSTVHSDDENSSTAPPASAPFSGPSSARPAPLECAAPFVSSPLSPPLGAVRSNDFTGTASFGSARSIGSPHSASGREANLIGAVPHSPMGAGGGGAGGGGGSFGSAVAAAAAAAAAAPMNQPANLNVAHNEELPLPNLAAFVPHALRTVELPSSPGMPPPAAGLGGGGGGTLQFHPNIVRSQPQSPQSSSLASPGPGSGGPNAGNTASFENAASAMMSNSNTNSSNNVFGGSSKMHPQALQPTSGESMMPQVSASSAGASPHRSSICTDSDIGSPFAGQRNVNAVAAHSDNFKWWENVTAATCGTGTVLALNMALPQLTFSGPVLGESAKMDIDAVSRLVSIALEVGDSYGAVIDSFNLQWVVMSFNVLRPCPDHEKAAAHCAILIRSRFIQMSANMSPQSSPASAMTGSGAGSPLTNPALKPLVPFSIGIDRGMVLGGHVGHGSVLRSFVLYGSPVERSRDLALLGGTNTYSSMAPILCTEAFNDKIGGASCSSLLVDFVEFAADSSGKSTLPQSFDSPMMPPVAPRQGDGGEDGGGFSPNPRMGSNDQQVPSGKHRYVVSVFDIYEELEEFQGTNSGAVSGNSSMASRPAFLSKQSSPDAKGGGGGGGGGSVSAAGSGGSVKEEEEKEDSVSPQDPNLTVGPRSPLPALNPDVLDTSNSKDGNESEGSETKQEKEERFKHEVLDDYLEAVTLMRRGLLDACLRVCSKIESSTMLGSGGRNFVLTSPIAGQSAFEGRRGVSPQRKQQQQEEGEGDINSKVPDAVNTTQPPEHQQHHHHHSSPHNPRIIPMWLFQVKRHVARIRRNVQSMFQRGLEGQLYVRHNQSRWAILEPDMGSTGGTPLLLRHLDPGALGGGEFSHHGSNSRSQPRDGSLDMTIRSLNMTSRSLARKRNLEDSPTKLIAALQAQATAPTPFHPGGNRAGLTSPPAVSPSAAAAASSSAESGGMLVAADSSNHSGGGSVPRDRATSADSSVLIPSPMAGVFTAVPDLFQDMNGVWYRKSSKILGRGAFGEVCLGIRPYDGILVAMKTLSLAEEQEEEVDMTTARRRRAAMAMGIPGASPPRQSHAGEVSASKLEKVVAEVLLMAKLKNQNIVSLLGCAVCGQNVVLLLEFVSGGSLESLLTNFGSFDIPSTQRYLKDILRGLRFLHERSYIHRDVKTANILMHIDGSCKLADLGSGIAMKESGHVAVQGTPYFMSPEAARGQPTPASDIWAVGIVACQLVSNQIPLKIAKDKISGQQGLHRLLYHLTHEEVEFDFPETVLREESLHNFVLSCLRPKPEDRPTAEQLLMHPFMMQQFRNRDVVSASPSARRSRKRGATTGTGAGTGTGIGTGSRTTPGGHGSESSSSMNPVRMGSALELGSGSDFGSRPATAMSNNTNVGGGSATPYSAGSSTAENTAQGTPDLLPSPVRSGVSEALFGSK